MQQCVTCTTLAHLSCHTSHGSSNEFARFLWLLSSIQMRSKFMYELNAHLSCHYGMLQQYQLGGTFLSPLPALTKFKFSDDIYTHTYTRTHVRKHARTTFCFLSSVSIFFFSLFSLFFSLFLCCPYYYSRFCSPHLMRPCRFSSQTTQSNFCRTRTEWQSVAAAAHTKSTIYFFFHFP